MEYDKAKGKLEALNAIFLRLRSATREECKPLQRMVAAELNGLATLAGLKPVALGGIPLDEDDDTTTTIGEIPT